MNFYECCDLIKKVYLMYTYFLQILLLFYKKKFENVPKIYKRPNFLESILINDYRVLFGEELMLESSKNPFHRKISSLAN